MPAALIVEAGIVAMGLYLFLRGGILSRSRSIALAVLCLVVLAVTVAGMTLASPPPSPQVIAGSSLATLHVVCALALWFGRLRVRGTPIENYEIE